MDMFYLTPLRAAELDDGDAETPRWIQLAPYGTWKPYGNDLSVTPEMAQQMVSHFKQNVRGHAVAFDYEHGTIPTRGTKASGWLQDVEARTDGLWGLVKWTKNAWDEIKAGEWKYFSLEWMREWPHPTTGVNYSNVIFGGGLTNRPQHKGRLPINASELVLETDMPTDDPQAQKPQGDDANPDSPLDPNQSQPKAPGHDEPGTAGDNPSPVHPADDDPSGKADDDSIMARMKAWFAKNVDNPEDDKTQEGDVVKLDEFRKVLGLSDDADEDAILSAAKAMKDEVEPLRKAASEVDAGRKFASEFPEQHERLVRLEQESRIARASEFADQFKNIGDDKALSPTAREKVAEAYLAVENGSLTASEFGEALALVTDKDHIVPLGEQGSSHAGEANEPTVDSFTEKIREYQKSDNLDYRSAVAMASEKHPELAAAYHEHYQKVKG
jgi:hypothetical protein